MSRNLARLICIFITSSVTFISGTTIIGIGGGYYVITNRKEIQQNFFLRSAQEVARGTYRILEVKPYRIITMAGISVTIQRTGTQKTRRLIAFTSHKDYQLFANLKERESTRFAMLPHPAKYVNSNIIPSDAGTAAHLKPVQEIYRLP